MSADFDYSLEIEVVSSSTNIAQDCIRYIGGHNFDIIAKTHNVISSKPITIIDSAPKDIIGDSQTSVIEKIQKFTSEEYKDIKKTTKSIAESIENINERVTSIEKSTQFVDKSTTYAKQVYGCTGFSAGVTGLDISATGGSITGGLYANCNVLRSTGHFIAFSTVAVSVTDCVGSNVNLRESDLKIAKLACFL